MGPSRSTYGEDHKRAGPVNSESRTSTLSASPRSSVVWARKYIRSWFRKARSSPRLPSKGAGAATKRLWELASDSCVDAPQERDSWVCTYAAICIWRSVSWARNSVTSSMVDGLGVGLCSGFVFVSLSSVWGSWDLSWLGALSSLAPSECGCSGWSSGCRGLGGLSCHRVRVNCNDGWLLDLLNCVFCVDAFIGPSCLFGACLPEVTCQPEPAYLIWDASTC